MPSRHNPIVFESMLHWPLDNSTASHRSKTHRISLSGKAPIAVSAAKFFKGDPSIVNPEELLLTAVSSCHFMSYQYVCQQAGIIIMRYEDNAMGELMLNADGSGRFVSVTLHPQVWIASVEKADVAHALHQRANTLCFIANSCNFPIHHKVTIREHII